jgi:hypothetical protein
VTARQSRLVARGDPSISSDASSQSSAESLACSGPNNSVTASMNADNSRSAIWIWSPQGELQNDSSLSMEPSRNQGAYCVKTKSRALTGSWQGKQVLSAAVASGLPSLNCANPQPPVAAYFFESFTIN